MRQNTSAREGIYERSLKGICAVMCGDGSNSLCFNGCVQPLFHAIDFVV